MAKVISNLIGLGLLFAIVLTMACQCFGEVTAVAAAYQDGNGWTDLPANGNVYYVSQSIGSDSYNGESGTVDGGGVGPKQTLAAGLALLSAGDHLLLKRGDTWTDEELGYVSGTDEDNMTLIGAYGTGARPEVASTSGSACLRAINISGGYFAVIGLHLHPNNRATTDGGVGIQLFFQNGVGEVLVEDCLIDGYLENTSFKASNDSTTFPDGLTIRRNIIINARRELSSGTTPTGDRALGTYINDFTNVLIEENIYDHNGWTEAFSMDTSSQDHNIYIADNTPSVTFRKNISSRSCYHGIKFDTDIGTHQIYDNFFSRNGSAAQIGGGPSDGGPTGGADGMNVACYNNCWVEGSDEAGAGLGVGVDVSNQKDGYFRNNFIGNRAVSGSTTTAVSFQDAEDGAGAVNYTIDSNVFYEQRGEHRFLDPSEGVYSNCVVSNNHFQGPNQSTFRDLIRTTTTALGGITLSNNTYFHGEDDDTYTFEVDGSPVSVATWQSTYEATATVSNLTSSYTAPTRTATTFATSHANGYASYQEWIDDLVTQERGDWDETIMAEAARDYIFEGFDMSQFAPASTKRVLILQ